MTHPKIDGALVLGKPGESESVLWINAGGKDFHFIISDARTLGLIASGAESLKDRITGRSWSEPYP